MPRIQGLDCPPLSRDELAVAIILKIQQLAAGGRQGVRQQTASVNPGQRSPLRQMQQRAAQWAQERARQLDATGQWPQVVASLQAKGYAGESRAHNGE